MAESEEKNKGFKVEDKRRFSMEGEPRVNAPEKEESRTATGRPEPEPGTAAAPRPDRSDRHAAPHGAEISFATFVVSLSTQALMHLGEMPDPISGATARDLAAAQQMIDIIAMLQEKTLGNLDRDEAKLVETILFDLRMKYVEIARRSSS